jgi:plastocyanin
LAESRIRKVKRFLCFFFFFFSFVSDSRFIAVLGGQGYSADNQYFAPAQVTIYAGDSVLWFWTKGTHNVVQVHNGSSVQALRDTHRGLVGFGLPPTEKGSYFWTFTDAGEYHFICEPHIDCCQMRGVVVVIPRPASMPLAPAFGAAAALTAAAAATAPTLAASGTRSFLDDLVLGGQSHATDVIDGARAPVTLADIISDSHFVNGDDAEHRVTVEVTGAGGRTRFNRVAFFLTLVALGAVLLVFILCYVRRRAAPPSGKARVVLHAPPARFDMPA